uniref:Uncharacterized protein n=1 Tax=Podoviridae sp. cti6G1 TaxID=2826570 RepID=A0A8S5LUQ3_9CAUD|nr:MAG TPA: hypothetical protein [Podoviridae sp. cti6G1]
MILKQNNFKYKINAPYCAPTINSIVVNCSIFRL